MVDLEARAEVVRTLAAIERELPASWAGSSTWADLVQDSADLLCEIGDRLSPMQLATMMALGAMAHRQCKIERVAEQGEVEHG